MLDLPLGVSGDCQGVGSHYRYRPLVRTPVVLALVVQVLVSVSLPSLWPPPCTAESKQDEGSNIRFIVIHFKIKDNVYLFRPGSNSRPAAVVIGDGVMVRSGMENCSFLGVWFTTVVVPDPLAAGLIRIFRGVFGVCGSESSLLFR